MNCARCDDRGWTLRDARIDVCDCGTYDPPKWVRRGDIACLVPHHKDPDRPRRAATGYVCAGHHARLEQLLAELPVLYDDLALQLTASEKPGGDGHTRSSHTSAGVNLNDRVTAARDELHAECVRVAREVSEGTGDPLPTTDRVPVITGWLLTRLGWLCEQLDVDETFRYLEALRRDCWRLAYPSGRHRIEIGPCGDAGCPGVLWLVGDTDEGRTMSCDDCCRVVEPRYWRRERRRIDGVDVNPWLTAAEAAELYGCTSRTVERWVAKGRLKSRGSPLRVKASAVEALMRSFTNRCA